ncbi:MAG: bifunctional diaminohydroxyphosphoribosylaminopyrimidine deaminase/5-amino-6-(5-phosphoribosylamino)uracil reductase RibD [Fibrobacter sp.]|jgi:diaminohydroxyphosphoribosylaminopyrimidine deaminase/5-amino-6-(5-phosphoribosylamino)uracil reductase|nr:bifunctional diaminohydroxyphosphoribosylaminopyrimidine deaminase/5-amino-6-(5-phosphoribosylamino)uracil reductase RibD [Fibrobacter sp.]
MVNKVNTSQFPFMQRALSLAYEAVGVSAPNPAVGAVVVLDGNVVGEGFTQAPGSFHAEVAALRNAGELARGADLWVTLEPCCFYGRTPPCTTAIMNAGIKRVFYSHGDPNPRVYGKSKQILESAGIEVFEGICEQESARFYEAYDYFSATGHTFVEVKIAQTKDGFIAGKNGKPIKITSAETDCLIHRERASSDAILVGGGTLLNDNPSLTVRLFQGNSPPRIIFSGKRIIPDNLNIFQSGAPPVVYSLVPQPALENKAEVRLLQHPGFRENWLQMLRDLSRAGKHRLMVEPGAELARLIFTSGLWNRLNLWTSPQEIHEGTAWNQGFFALETPAFSAGAGDRLLEFQNHFEVPAF